MDSILAQTYENFELIVVDDGSSDDTVAVLQRYKDERLRVLVNETNQGMVYALNKGIGAARGEFIARQDADDLSTPNRFEKQMAYMQANPQCALLGARCKTMDSHGHELNTPSPRTKIREITFDELLGRNCLAPHGVIMIRKSALDDVGFYNTAFRYAQDYELWLRISKKYPAAKLPDILYAFRVHGAAQISYRHTAWQALADYLARDLHSDKITPAQVDAYAKNITDYYEHLPKRGKIFFHQRCAGSAEYLGNWDDALKHYQKLRELSGWSFAIARKLSQLKRMVRNQPRPKLTTPPSTEHAEFRFTPEMLAAPRKPGISAYMRIKNEEQFVRLAILSHLDYYDEIIACYNGCTDNTESILHELANQHPQKIKVFHYLPKVHPILTAEHANTPADSLHSMANYYNYALSKTTYSVATKLDADHLAIGGKLAPAIAAIRADIKANKTKTYYFSGLNLMHDSHGAIGVNLDGLFSGNEDIVYHPVNPNVFYRQRPRCESINKPYLRTLPAEYMGILYFHLHYLKHELCGVNAVDKFGNAIDRSLVAPFADLYSPQCQKKLRAQLNPYERMHCALYASEKMRRWKYQLTGTPPKLHQLRLARLADDLRDIDFARDVLGRLGD